MPSAPVRITPRVSTTSPRATTSARTWRDYYYATNGYDLCTGWGTPTGTSLINALAPYPYIVTPPASQTATNGYTVSFNVIAGGQPAFSYDWLFNGTNLPPGSNVSGN